MHSARIAETLDAGSTWDPDVPHQSGENAGETLGTLLGFVNPLAGAVVSALSGLAPSAPRPEASWSHPDPVVQARWTDATGNRHITTARLDDTVRPVWDTSFFVHASSTGPGGLGLSVIDHDGGGGQAPLIGEVTVPVGALRAVAGTGSVEELALQNHELMELRVRIEPVRLGVQLGQTRVDAPLRTGLTATTLTIPAGGLVRVEASGSGTVGGSWACPAEVGPRGVPDGQCRNYNLLLGSLPNAPHGSAVAMVGHEPSLFAASFGDVPDTGFACIEFFSPSSGTLVLGVNDRDASNNGGGFAFDVTVQAPTDDAEPTVPGEVWACAHPEMHEIYEQEW